MFTAANFVTEEQQKCFQCKFWHITAKTTTAETSVSSSQYACMTHLLRITAVRFPFLVWLWQVQSHTYRAAYTGPWSRDLLDTSTSGVTYVNESPRSTVFYNMKLTI